MKAACLQFIIPRSSFVLLLLVLLDVLLQLLAFGVVGFGGEELFVLGGGAVFEAGGVVERGEAQVCFEAAQARGLFEVGDGFGTLLELEVGLAEEEVGVSRGRLGGGGTVTRGRAGSPSPPRRVLWEGSRLSPSPSRPGTRGGRGGAVAERARR